MEVARSAAICTLCTLRGGMDLMEAAPSCEEVD